MIMYSAWLKSGTANIHVPELRDIIQACYKKQDASIGFIYQSYKEE